MLQFRLLFQASTAEVWWKKKRRRRRRRRRGELLNNSNTFPCFLTKVLHQQSSKTLRQRKEREIEGNCVGSRFCVIDDVADVCIRPDEYVSKLSFRVTTTMHYFSSIVFRSLNIFSFLRFLFYFFFRLNSK